MERRSLVLVVVLMALMLAGCLDGPADHAVIANEGTEAADLHGVFASPDGRTLHEERFTLRPGERTEFPLERSGDGYHALSVEAADGRSHVMELHWQGNSGPHTVDVVVHDDRIEGRETNV